MSKDKLIKRDELEKNKKKSGNILTNGFFGWNNFKWLIKELVKIYSDAPSYFSKKRLESSIAFTIAQWGMVIFLLQNYSNMSISEFLLWASAEFAIAGYYVNEIQREKKTIKNKDATTKESQNKKAGENNITPANSIVSNPGLDEEDPDYDNED